MLGLVGRRHRGRAGCRIEDHDQLRWLDRDSLYAVPWLPADLPIVRAAEARMAGPA